MNCANHSQMIFRWSFVSLTSPFTNRDASPSSGQHESFSSLPMSRAHLSGSSTHTNITHINCYLLCNSCYCKAERMHIVFLTCRVCVSPVMSDSCVCESVMRESLEESHIIRLTYSDELKPRPHAASRHASSDSGPSYLPIITHQICMFMHIFVDLQGKRML